MFPHWLPMADRPSNLRMLAPMAGLAMALCYTAPLCDAASEIKLTGSLLGSVKDSSGVPQMGATVLLFNRYDKVVEKAITNLRGDFLVRRPPIRQLQRPRDDVEFRSRHQAQHPRPAWDAKRSGHQPGDFTQLDRTRLYGPTQWKLDER